MAKDTTGAGAAAPADAKGNGAAPALNILAQYVKDLSFENPGAPKSLGPRDKAPEININVNVNANPLGETEFDVVLTLNAEAKNGETVVFNVELVYGGVFRVANFPQEHMLPLLFIECPRLLFPFAADRCRRNAQRWFPAPVDRSDRLCADVPAAYGGRKDEGSGRKPGQLMIRSELHQVLGKPPSGGFVIFRGEANHIGLDREPASGPIGLEP
jgi:preprotein translocase subunit SecB